MEDSEQGSDFPEMGNQVRYQHSTFSVEREGVCFHTSRPVLNHQHRPIRLQLKRQLRKTNMEDYVPSAILIKQLESCDVIPI